MKILMLIFSIYLLVLPGISCAEVAVCAEDELECVLTQAGECEAGGCEEGQTDDCGSFCTCSCCVHIMSVNFQSPGLIIETPTAKHNLQIIYNNISLPSNYFGNIWQPPKQV